MRCKSLVYQANGPPDFDVMHAAWSVPGIDCMTLALSLTGNFWQSVNKIASCKDKGDAPTQSTAPLHE